MTKKSVAAVAKSDEWPKEYKPQDLYCPRCKSGINMKCHAYDPDTGVRVDLPEYHDERVQLAIEAPEYAERGYEDGRNWRPQLMHYTDDWKIPYGQGWWIGRREVVDATLREPVNEADVKPGDWLVFPIDAMSTVAMVSRLDRSLSGEIVRASLDGDDMYCAGGGIRGAARLPQAAWAPEPGLEHIDLPVWLYTGDDGTTSKRPHGIQCAFYYRRGFHDAEVGNEFSKRHTGGYTGEAYKQGWIAGGGAVAPDPKKAEEPKQARVVRKKPVRQRPPMPIPTPAQPSLPVQAERARIVQSTLF